MKTEEFISKWSNFWILDKQSAELTAAFTRELEALMPSPSHAAQDRGEGKTELLFQGFRLDGTVAFTGLSIDGIAASYSPEKIKEMKLFEWTGVLDWHGQHIYRGNKVTSYNGKTGKEFTGIVEYEPQGCMYIIKGESRYLELSASAAQGDENGIKLTDVQIIGRAKI